MSVILIITYDLHQPGRSYPAVERLLTAVPYAHPQGSVWFIDTASSPDSWVEALRQVGDNNDEYFAARIASDWQATRQDPQVSEWLNSPTRNW